jgi:phosphoribosyl 1,2-cyclic phosphodiesterase
MTDKLRFVSLQSGSNGNCLFVESNGTRLLFDAGLTGLQTKLRLAEIGVDPATIQGLVISHAHSDHISGAGVLHRQFGIPVWMTHGTFVQAKERKKIGRIGEPNLFSAGTVLRFGSMTVETIQTTHDASDAVCFIVDNGTVRLGIMTDMGCRFLGLKEAVATLDGILLESNYDSDMLENGYYSAELKQRIRSGSGHLSNIEAAELLHDAGKKLRWACLGHLSADNNRPEIAVETHRKILGGNLPLYAASRYELTAVPEL